ncbi:MAG: hypothetical protein A4E33_00003 [Methanoregula sp. PtaB.Bin085]|nr:MAG: hypothetical protein A4E33_00003 [Methanoregula sp. PtaB.Bin085]
MIAPQDSSVVTIRRITIPRDNFSSTTSPIYVPIANPNAYARKFAILARSFITTSTASSQITISKNAITAARTRMPLDIKTIRTVSIVTSQTRARKISRGRITHA